MGEVNDILCNYFSIPEVFADFWNGTLFEGEQVLQSRYLYKHDKEYYKEPKQTGKKATSIRRDVSMRYCADVELILGMELLDTIDYSIAVRLMDYDVQELKRQLKEIAYGNRKWSHSGEFLYGVRKDDRLIPVVSVALYCGRDSYDGTRDIKELFKKTIQASRWQAWIKNYPASIYDLWTLKEENYQTGLRELVGVFKRSKDKEAMLEYYEQHKERFRRLDEWTINAMSVLIGQKTLNLYTKEGDGLDLCKAFEDAIEEGRVKGRAEGHAEGRAEGAFSALSDLVRDGLLRLEEAAKRLNMTEEAFAAKMQA